MELTDPFSLLQLVTPFALWLMIVGFSITAIILSVNRKLTSSAKKMEAHNQRKQAHNRVLELLFTNAPLNDILDAVIKTVELQNPENLCSVLLVSKDGRYLHIGAAPNLPDFYKEAINNLEIGPKMPSCGISAYTGKRAFVEDILCHPNWSQYKVLANQAGLISCWSEPIKSSGGQILGSFAIYRREAFFPTDSEIRQIEQTTNLASIVIEKVQNAEALQQSHHLLSKISAEIPGVIFQFRLYPDGRMCFPFVSEAIRTMYGHTPESVREDATPIFNYQHPDDAGRVMESIKESARTMAPWNIEYRIILPVQGLRWRMGKAHPEKLDDGSVLWHGFIADITDSKNAAEQIRHMAQYDQLTDLPNRALLSDRLQQALAIAKREQTGLALLFMDLDKFKTINDSLGHAIGDALLQRAAARMPNCMRESDTIARIGGDEFVVLIPCIESEQDALLVAEKIRLSLEQPFEIEGYLLSISTSIGIAIYPEQGEDEIELAKHADLAMYYAKQNGRNQIMIYHENMKVVGQ